MGAENQIFIKFLKSITRCKNRLEYKTLIKVNKTQCLPFDTASPQILSAFSMMIFSGVFPVNW